MEIVKIKDRNNIYINSKQNKYEAVLLSDKIYFR